MVAAGVVESDLPVDLRQTLRPHRRGGAADPCVKIGASGAWMATRLPTGPATLHLRSVGPCRVEVRAWGPGAEEARSRAPGLVGATDDDGGFATCDHRLVRDLARRFPGLRMTRSGNPIEALVPTILEQKVQGPRARAAFRAMVRGAGAAAPTSGEPGAPRLLLPPTAEWVAAQPSWRWHGWGVEGKRVATLRTAAATARRIAETADMAPADAVRRLQALPGIGVWSAAEVAAVAFGDPDAVSVGDYWLAHHVCHTLAGEVRGSDARMLELLAPWSGQRGRLCRLIMVGGPPLPRFGPRLPLLNIADI